MITKESVRRLMIEKQRIGEFTGSPNVDDVYSTVESLGCLQIDTISVVDRAQYLTLWSRLGNYDKQSLERLAYDERKLFEYWAHAACYIPYTDYRYYLTSMEVRKNELMTRLNKRTGKGKDLIDLVIQRIKNEGPIASKDFDSEKKGKGGWWNRKDEKVAMDYLYGAGILAISRRDNFQRYYDLAEKVVPSWVDLESPCDDDRVWFFTEKTMKCLGAIQPKEAREYYQHFAVKLGRTSSQLEELIKTKENVEEIKIKKPQSMYYCLTDDASRLEAIDDDFSFEDVRLLVYFDNFMWNRDRIKRLFDFESKLEIYLPKEERVFGYYHLPVLYGDRIVARLEPKMDRKEKELLIRGYWTEKGFKETEEYKDKLEKNLEDFAAFHGAETIKWLC